MSVNENGMKSDKSGSEYPDIVFITGENRISRFFPLLQGGFVITARVGCSIDRFLREEIGAGAEIIEKIQSVFLDGRPVDNLGSAIVRDGSTLAFSAALPGLVGATMRRGGAYSSFRGPITYRETVGICPEGEGLVRLKLFNLIAGELGPGFLKKGILVKSSDLADFLKERSPDLWKGCSEVFVDGNPADPAYLMDTVRLSRCDRVRLRVETT